MSYITHTSTISNPPPKALPSIAATKGFLAAIKAPQQQSVITSTTFGGNLDNRLEWRR